MSGLAFKVTSNLDEIKLAITSLGRPVAKAAKLAIEDAGEILKTEARAHIRAVGFSKRWANAYRVTVYPKTRDSIDAAAQGLLKHIDYSDIYALGGTIVGSPLLWVPFSTTPKLDNRRTSASIKSYEAKGVELEAIHNRGHPILGVKVQMTKSQARQKRIKLTKADVTRGFRKAPRQKKGRAAFVWKVVPLFFGLRSVTIKKRFSWERVQSKVQALVPALYDKRIRDVADFRG